MKNKLFILLLFPLFGLGQSPKPTSSKFKEDFDFFWKSVEENYCYFDKKQTDWTKAKEMYSQLFDTLSNRGFLF